MRRRSGRNTSTPRNRIRDCGRFISPGSWRPGSCSSPLLCWFGPSGGYRKKVTREVREVGGCSRSGSPTFAVPCLGFSAPTMEEYPMLSINTILHPNDLSESAKNALHFAAAVARDSDARLILLYV